MKTILLSTAYLPPVSYFVEWLKADSVCLETHEHFVKQTYRNRSSIYSANGKLDLIIPVMHANLYSIPISDVQIAYQENWQIKHWRSIESAYRKSSYFEFYESFLFPLFCQREKSLFEWNSKLLNSILRHLKINHSYSLTESYNATPDVYDYRNKITPASNPGFELPKYFQVFSLKYGFIPNLSILDLLFNIGNQSAAYLSAVKSTP
jgi:hypothetical protein